MKTTFLTLFMALICLAGCRQPHHVQTPISYAANCRGIYYWRTSFSLDDSEVQFLKKHHIEKLYVRFFDVDVNPDSTSNEKCIPVATIDFKSPLPKNIEIVPTVFITPDAIRHYQDFSEYLARRIIAMCQYSEIDVHEIQFDCDWTASTQEDYFQFLKDIREKLKHSRSSILISSTIRLHQLAQTAPDVDYGMLMCYNTGDFRDFDTHNAILDLEDVKPYLKDLKSYPLPLALALPTYAWNVEFSDDQHFKALNQHSFDFSDTQQFRKTDRENVYQQLKNGQPSQYIRHESVSAQTLLKTKRSLLRSRKNKMYITLYHLDSVQLSKYSDHDIEKIYR